MSQRYKKILIQAKSVCYDRYREHQSLEREKSNFLLSRTGCIRGDTEEDSDKHIKSQQTHKLLSSLTVCVVENLDSFPHL